MFDTDILRKGKLIDKVSIQICLEIRSFSIHKMLIFSQDIFAKSKAK